MAKLKYSKTLYKLRRLPELPDWYRYLQIFIGVIIAVVLLVSIITPSEKKNNIASNTELNSNTSTEAYTPTPIDGNVSNEDNSGTSTTTIDTLAGESIVVATSKIDLAKNVALARYTGVWDKVTFGQNDSIDNDPTGLKPKIGKIYLLDSTSSNISFLIVVIKNPETNSDLGIQNTINLTLENGNWVFNPNSNAGL
jgi:hypothetical protein